jgi:hypothetical protein
MVLTARVKNNQISSKGVPSSKGRGQEITPEMCTAHVEVLEVCVISIMN